MFVILEWPAAGYGPSTPSPQQRPSVWRCEAAEWQSGALVMTNAVAELGNPREPIPTIIIVPWQGTTIEIRPS